MAPLPFDEGLDDLVAGFRLYGIAAGHSPRTIESRASTVRRLGSAVDPLMVGSEDLVSWLAGLELARSSRATYRAHLRAFFGWLHRTDRRQDNPALDLPSARAPRGVPRPISPAGVSAILGACGDPRAQQTRAYVLLAAYEGLRVHEIAKVRGEDFAEGEVLVRGKGGVVSSVPMHPLIANLVRSMPVSGFWFPSSVECGHVNRVSVSLAIGRAMRRAGVSGTPHALRHHFGTQVLRASGGDLRTAQRVLRHASPATTAIYTQVLDAAAFRAVSGIPAA
ncbi:MAG: tyrosine-type recombinase/integrase [Sterolibacteriaceae bacterium]|nr:tyrosine-type recombinase/integrase [Sterolibacteriaceae bacterium]